MPLHRALAELHEAEADLGLCKSRLGQARARLTKLRHYVELAERFGDGPAEGGQHVSEETPVADILPPPTAAPAGAAPAGTARAHPPTAGVPGGGVAARTRRGRAASLGAGRCDLDADVPF